MARKRKGRPVHGWLLVDKPAGVGSTQVVNKLRWLLKAQKAGHAGTLDPDATGLLPVAFGHATRLLPYLEDHPKTYTFAANWGAETTTDDRAGEVTCTADVRPSPDEIAAVLGGFRGEITQVPPQVSAVKVDGERAYDRARAGEVMALKSRPLTVHDLRLTRAEAESAGFTMTCGKGGYVRSMARDIGRALGTRAHVAWLRRMATCGFDVGDALPFAAFTDMPPEALDSHLHPPEAALSSWPHIALDDMWAAHIFQGRAVQPPMPAYTEPPEFIALTHENRLVAIGRFDPETALIHPERVFHP